MGRLKRKQESRHYSNKLRIFYLLRLAAIITRPYPDFVVSNAEGAAY